ncbi:MAG: isocitrate lyase/PEP mutase family protein, partial [Burkholderiaceae bacterium]
MTNPLNRELRDALVPGAGLLMPGAANALTARIIEDCDHRVFLVSGAAIANTYLGVPDIGLVSLSELAGHVSSIRDAVNLPMVVDGDTGFGNAINVGHTVRVLERAGANAIMLEDQTFPKRWAV